MATTPKKAPARKRSPAPAYVKADEFNSFKEETTANMSTIIGMLKEQAAKPAEAPASSETASEVEKEVKKADPNAIPVNPEWEQAARDIIGADVVDHCEMNHLKSGGILFTVVIRNDKSNAPKDYLERYKMDRRTKEIGNEGFGGVELWCKLIKQNLARQNANSQR
jgi:hypothetical protein